MEFCFFKNEKKELINLINNSFNMDNREENFILQPYQRFLLLKDNELVIGASLITEKYDPIKKVKTMYLDYVCISDKYRGKGLGEKLMLEIIKIAKEENFNRIQLTSSKKRVCARNLYQKLGMKIVDTDIFVKEL